MFDKINKTFFGKRVVKDVTVEDPSGMVVVTFSDDQKPESEKMHVSEWESGKSDKIIEKPDQVQEWFVKRTTAMRQEVINKAVSFNPRFTDLKKIVGWIVEGVNMTYSKVVSSVFDVDNFDTQATVDMVLKKLEENGQEIGTDWPEHEKEMLLAVRDGKVLVHQITTESYFGSIQKKLENLISEGVALALGGSDEARRCSDMENLIQQHAKTGSPTGQEGVGEDNAPAAVSPAQSEDKAGTQSEDNKDLKTGADEGV